MKRKLIALALVLCLCLGVMPLGTAAAQTARPMAEPTVQPQALPELPEAELNGTHSVTMNVTGDGGTAELYATSANTGESVYFLADPEPGYKVDLSKSYHYGTIAPKLYYLGMNMYELVMPDGDAVLEVEFVEITSASHDVVVDAPEGGMITVSQSSAKAGESILLEIVVQPGYNLDSVSTSYSGGHADAFDLGSIGGAYVYEIFMPDAELTIHISFTRNGPYAVEAVIDSDPAGGKLELSHTQAYEAETVTVTAIPDTGYQLKTIGCTSTEMTKVSENQYTFQMPKWAEKVHASFAPIDYSLSLSVEHGIGGTAAFNKDAANYGDTIILTCQPQEGYRVARITGMEMQDLGDNIYTFKMPAENVEIQILFLRENNPFLDVNETHYFHDPVLWAVEKGITSGATGTTFDPNGDLLRAQVVVMLWRHAGQPEPETAENPFTDVKETDFYYKAVLWAVENGITSGTSATTFSPFGITNRAQAVTFLWRYLGKPASTASNSFTDVEAGQWYVAAINWAVENGITNGMGGGIFGISQNCNRAQMVTFLYRAVGQNEE